MDTRVHVIFIPYYIIKLDPRASPPKKVARAQAIQSCRQNAAEGLWQFAFAKEACTCETALSSALRLTCGRKFDKVGTKPTSTTSLDYGYRLPSMLHTSSRNGQPNPSREATMASILEKRSGTGYSPAQYHRSCQWITRNWPCQMVQTKQRVEGRAWKSLLRSQRKREGK